MGIFDNIFVSRKQMKYKASEQFNPSRVLAKINKTGVAAMHTYEAIITPPSFNSDITRRDTPVLNSGSFAKNELRFKIEQTEFPGRNVKTTDYAIGNAPIQSIGYGFTYAPINMQVIVNENMDEKVFFEQWQEIVSNASTANVTEFDRFSSNYYDKYVGTIEINQYDKEGNKVYRAQLKNAYPTFVSPVNVAWSSTNEYMKIMVTISYQSWKRLDHRPSLGNQSGREFSTL